MEKGEKEYEKANQRIHNGLPNMWEITYSTRI